jgi:hypothetical protein
MNDNDMLEYINQSGTWTQIKYKELAANGWRTQGDVLFYKDSFGQWSGTKYRVISTGDEEEMSFFYHENDGPMYEVASTNINHIIKHGYQTNGIKELKVKCLRIDKLFEKFSLKKIDILFIDTEGIDDLIIKDIDFNSFEINEIYFENLHLTQHDIYNFLEGKGYTIVRNWGHMGWTSFAKKNNN